MAENKDELKNLLMSMKEESEREDNCILAGKLS